DFFLGGVIELNHDLAQKAIEALALKLDMSIEETALGIIRISTSNMVQAIREVTVERGRDPRNFVLIPFGGAGSTQAVDIADALDIESILVPPHPGITSALGLICADLRVDVMKSVMLRLEDQESKSLLTLFLDLSSEAQRRLKEQGANPTEISEEWKVDMRYSGQSHELTIDVPVKATNLVSESRVLFEDEHFRLFGYKLESKKIDWVTVRVTALAKQTIRKEKPFEVQSNPIKPTARSVLLDDGTLAQAIVYKRNSIPSDIAISGPAIIEQVDTTTYLSPDWEMKQQTNGNIWMRRISS
ncbi:MAG: hydantoinase/oxoprolinase family protein, partial [Candidatus Thorarchaeota archaeon]